MKIIMILGWLVMFSKGPINLNQDEIDFIGNMYKLHGRPEKVDKVDGSVYMYYPTEIYELTPQGSIGDLYLLTNGEWVLYPEE